MFVRIVLYTHEKRGRTKVLYESMYEVGNHDEGIAIMNDLCSEFRTTYPNITGKENEVGSLTYSRWYDEQLKSHK